MIGFYMMYMQANIKNPAMLTGIAISLKSLGTLFFPIGAAIIRITAKPRWVIFSAPFWRGSPKTKALTAAKIMGFYSGWLFFNIASAYITLYDYALSPYTEPTGTLMDAITRGTAKTRCISSVLFDLKITLANFTNNSFHIGIIPHMDY